MTNDELYSEIEHSIIVWSNDGTKTAGTLTRQIMEIVNKSKQNTYTEEQMIQASKYGYEFRDTTSFPEHKFEDSCINNTRQWLQSLKQPK